MSYDSDVESRNTGTPRESNGRSDALTSAEKGTTARGVLSLNVTVGLAVALAAAVFCHAYTFRFFHVYLGHVYHVYLGWIAGYYALLIGADVFAAVVLVRALAMDAKPSRLRRFVAWCAGLPVVDLVCLIPAFFHAAASARRALKALDAAGTVPGAGAGKRFRFAFLHAWLIGLTLAAFVVGIFLPMVLFPHCREQWKALPYAVELIPYVFSGWYFLEFLSGAERFDGTSWYMPALNLLFYAFLFLRAAFVWRLGAALRYYLRTKSAAEEPEPAVGAVPPRSDAQ